MGRTIQMWKRNNLGELFLEESRGYFVFLTK